MHVDDDVIEGNADVDEAGGMVQLDKVRENRGLWK